MIFGIDPGCGGGVPRQRGPQPPRPPPRLDAAGTRRRWRLATVAAETSARIGDIQAVLPPLAALAAAQAGLGEDAAAVASIERGIELRGTSEEPTISAWYLFEVTDTLSTIAARDPSSGRRARRLGERGGVCPRPRPRGGSDRATSSRWPSARRVFGAAVDQLERLASAAGVAIDPPAESCPDTDEATRAARSRAPALRRRADPPLEGGGGGVRAGSRAGRRDLRGARRASVPRTHAEAPGLGEGPPDEPSRDRPLQLAPAGRRRPRRCRP